MTSQPRLQTIVIHILVNVSQIKGNQTMKLGQLLEYNKKKVFWKYTANLQENIHTKKRCQ